MASCTLEQTFADFCKHVSSLVTQGGAGQNLVEILKEGTRRVLFENNSKDFYVNDVANILGKNLSTIRFEEKTKPYKTTFNTTGTRRSFGIGVDTRQSRSQNKIRAVFVSTCEAKASKGFFSKKTDIVVVHYIIIEKTEGQRPTRVMEEDYRLYDDNDKVAELEAKEWVRNLLNKSSGDSEKLYPVRMLLESKLEKDHMDMFENFTYSGWGLGSKISYNYTKSKGACWQP